jgi:hypothetical protein
MKQMIKRLRMINKILSQDKKKHLQRETPKANLLTSTFKKTFMR